LLHLIVTSHLSKYNLDMAGGSGRDDGRNDRS